MLKLLIGILVFGTHSVTAATSAGELEIAESLVLEAPPEKPSYVDLCDESKSVKELVICLTKEINKRIDANASCRPFQQFKDMKIRVTDAKKMPFYQSSHGYDRILCDPQTVMGRAAPAFNGMWLCNKNMRSTAEKWNQSSVSKNDQSLYVILSMLAFETLTHEAIHVIGYEHHAPSMMLKKEEFQKCLGEKPVLGWERGNIIVNGYEQVRYVLPDWFQALVRSL